MQTSSSGSGKRQHVATLRSSDSPEGSRVRLSSDQSLNDYEAYRRGDRFYVKIPAAEVPRAEALRGRGFADVKVQRIGDSTVVSFRLQPGASARVEQHSNQLEVVFTLPGARPTAASNSGREVPLFSSNTNANANKNKKSNANRLSTSNAYKPNTSPVAVNKPAASRSNSLTAARNPAPAKPSNSNVDTKRGSSAALALNSGSKPAATPLASPLPSPTPKIQTPTPAPKPSSAGSQLAVNQPTSSTTNQSRQDRWGQMKERINYLILLAQLNPIPVAIGVAVLLLLSGLFLVQRRRAKSPRRARRVVPAKTPTTNHTAPNVPAATESKPESVITPAITAAALATPLVAATRTRETRPEPAAESQRVEVPAPALRAPASPLPSDEPRRERVAQVAEEAKNLMAGGSYDESVIGSDDRETRQLVGAELLSAIVGRNAQRRENAREAFMKHGYFDDATRDLRIADSPNERAAAARRLSFVHSNEATPHLIGALDDPSPDVRRAAVEALMDLRDPAAIGPLNSFMKTENDRKVPRTLIKHAIDACATVAPEKATSVAASNSPPATVPEPSSQPIETEREVIEL